MPSLWPGLKARGPSSHLLMRPASGLCSAPHRNSLKDSGWTPALRRGPWIPPIWAQTEAPEPVRTSITVVEKVTTEAPANITAVGKAWSFAKPPGVNLDDRLRDIPGFSMFRRSSSLVAHPPRREALRGIGSSGASRTLVLWDGIPLNDPFGGWVYWTRVAPEELERVEISRGASTAVCPETEPGRRYRAVFAGTGLRGRLMAGYEGGNRDTHEVSTGYSHVWQRIGLSAMAAPSPRTATTSSLRKSAATLTAKPRCALRRAICVWIIWAPRTGRSCGRTCWWKTGAMAQSFRTTRRRWEQLRAVSARVGQRCHLRARLPHAEEFRSGFSSIAADRDSERLTYEQSVPPEAVGGAALWRHGASCWNLLAGAMRFAWKEPASIRCFPPESGLAAGRSYSMARLCKATPRRA